MSRRHTTRAGTMFLATAVAVLTIQLSAVPAAWAAGTGRVITDFGSGSDTRDVANAVAIQPDGKIVAAGSGGRLARYNVNGSLDTTFGTGGKITTTFPGFSVTLNAIVIQPDGRIVAAGTISKTEPVVGDFALVRYNVNGSLDTTFGTGGKVTTDFANGTLDRGHDIVLQSDGRVVVAGRSAANFALARYNTDGSLDTTFGTGGKVTTDFASSLDQAFAATIQPDGRIVAAGETNRIESGFVHQNIGLARYNVNGSLDTTFGTGGKVTTEFAASSNHANDVALQVDGRIVAAGVVVNFTGTPGGFSDFALVRYNADGTLDTGFGIGGKVRTEFVQNQTDEANAVSIQPDGRVLAVGAATPSSSPFWPDFALARYNADGTLDTGFGIGGKVRTDFGTRLDEARAVAIQRDGRIVAAGDTYDNTTGPDFALARYNINGSLDTTFG